MTTKAFKYQIKGFKEAVFIVRDLAKTRNFYTEVVGWEVVTGTHTANYLANNWQLPEQANITSCVIAEPNTSNGFIRLVEIQGLEQEYIRSNAQIWDTGAIFDVNHRVKDSFELSRQLHEYGWFGVNEPVEMQFGPFKVYEWLAKSFDGITQALIERLDPPLENDNQQAKFSQLINASMIVKDHDEEKTFFETLGFEIMIHQQDKFDEAKSNVFGMPHELVAQTPHVLTLLSPDGGRHGTVELASFPELTGNDYSDRAKAPNLGIVSLRFPVKNLDALIQHLNNNEIEIITDCQMAIAGQPEVRNILIHTPAGSWIEFFE